MRIFPFKLREENKSGDGSNGDSPKKPETVSEKKEEIKTKADISKDDLPRMSEGTAHALLEEVRALRADLSSGLFGKKEEKRAPDAAKPDDQQKPEKSFLDKLIDFDL